MEAQLVPIEVLWKPRDRPLEPIAAAATGATAIEIGKLLLDLDDENLGRLKGAAGDHTIIILGEEHTLLWADGVVYLGQDPAAPSLLLPTNIQPDVPLTLFEKAIRSKYSELQPPLAVLPDGKLVSSVASTRTLDRAAIQKWLSALPIRSIPAKSTSQIDSHPLLPALGEGQVESQYSFHPAGERTSSRSITAKSTAQIESHPPLPALGEGQVESACSLQPAGVRALEGEAE